jgi:hypothetical protein
MIYTNYCVVLLLMIYTNYCVVLLLMIYMNYWLFCYSWFTWITGCSVTHDLHELLCCSVTHDLHELLCCSVTHDLHELLCCSVTHDLHELLCCSVTHDLHELLCCSVTHDLHEYKSSYYRHSTAFSGRCYDRLQHEGKKISPDTTSVVIYHNTLHWRKHVFYYTEWHFNGSLLKHIFMYRYWFFSGHFIKFLTNCTKLAIDMEITISEQSSKIRRRGWYCPNSAMFSS